MDQYLIASREADYYAPGSFPVMQLLKERGLKPKVVVAANTLDAQKQMVLQGLGIALLPEFVVHEELKRKKLELLAPRDRFGFTLKLVRNPKRALSLNATQFLATFREKVQPFFR